MEMEDGEMDEKKRQVSFQALLYNIDFTALFCKVVVTL